MGRPLLFHILPNRLKQWLYFRYFHTRHSEWPELFAAAPLALCPRVSMFDLMPGDVISGMIAFNGFYEWELTQRIAAHARGEGGLFVDVGANMGYFSLLWAGCGSGKVVAFEAAPRNIRLFENNVERNGLRDRIALVAKAAGNRSGTVTFEAGPVEQTGWGGIAAAESATAITVPMVRLDEELPDAKIDVLKIDVEGADTWVLFGCEALLKARKIDTIYFEQQPSRMERLGIGPGEAQHFLEKLGYQCRALSPDGIEWMAQCGTDF